MPLPTLFSWQAQTLAVRYDPSGMWRNAPELAGA